MEYVDRYKEAFAKQFSQGYASFHDGTVVNPLKYVNSDSYREWQRGWDSAYFENLEKVRERESLVDHIHSNGNSRN